MIFFPGSPAKTTASCSCLGLPEYPGYSYRERLSLCSECTLLTYPACTSPYEDRFFYPASEDTLYISLTGGRKTISADLQDAAVYFGSTFLFPIIDRDLHYQHELHELSWKGLQDPLPTAQATVFLPLRVGTYPFLDESILKRDFFSSTDFQMPEPEPNTLCTLESSTKLIDLIEQKKKTHFTSTKISLPKGIGPHRPA